MTFLPSQSQFKSLNNATQSPLNAGAIYTGTADSVIDYNTATIFIYTDADSFLTLEFSLNGTDFTASEPINIKANSIFGNTFNLAADYFRVKLTNKTENQTELNLQVFYSENKTPDFDNQKTIDSVMKGKINNEILIQKFGYNVGINIADTPCDICSSNVIYEGFPQSIFSDINVFSTSANDDLSGTGARKVRLYYLDGNYNIFDPLTNEPFFVDVDMFGTSQSTSITLATRVYKAEVIESGSGQINAGNITIIQDSFPFLDLGIIPIIEGESRSSNFTIPFGYDGYIRSLDVIQSDDAASYADMCLMVREFGSNTWKQTNPFRISTSKNYSPNIVGGWHFKERTDLIFRCLGVANNGARISVNYTMHLVKKDN